MKSCPEGAFTGGHVGMAIVGGVLVGIVLAAILNNAGWLRDPPNEG